MSNTLTLLKDINNLHQKRYLPTSFYENVASEYGHFSLHYCDDVGYTFVYGAVLDDGSSSMYNFSVEEVMDMVTNSSDTIKERRDAAYKLCDVLDEAFFRSKENCRVLCDLFDMKSIDMFYTSAANKFTTIHCIFNDGDLHYSKRVPLDEVASCMQSIREREKCNG